MRGSIFFAVIMAIFQQVCYGQSVPQLSKIDTENYIILSDTSKDSTSKGKAIHGASSESGKVQFNHIKNQLSASNQNKVLELIVEFKEEPAFIRTQSQTDRKSTSNARLEASNRFSQFASDLNNLQKSGSNSRVATQTNATVEKEFYKVFYGVHIKVPAELRKAVASLPYVKSVQENTEVQAYLDKSVPAIKANLVWSTLGSKGENIVVGIIDTGIDYTHPALGGGIGASYKVIGGYDFVNNDSDPMDDNSHGTHCAGIVAADGVNIQGVAPKAKLVALKVLDSQGKGTNANIISAIEWSVDPNRDGNYSDRLDVVNMSLGGPGGPSDAVSTAVNNAVKLGVVYCVAAGNDGAFYTIGSPGCAKDAITVGASYDPYNIAGFSSRGPNKENFHIKPEVIAPGYSIKSTVLNKGFDNYSGTSMATPHIAGVVALIKKLHPTWTPLQIKSAIVNSASSIYTEVMSQGAGQVDALKAAQVSTFAYPAVLSFGRDNATLSTWQIKDSIIVTNLHASSQTYNVDISGLKPGISILVNTSSFTLNAGASKKLIFTLSVNNTSIGKAPSESGSYDGMTKITGSKDLLSIPWSFVRTSIVTFKFDFKYPYFVLNSKTKNFTSSTVEWSEGGYQASLPIPEDEYDILLTTENSSQQTCYIAKENQKVQGDKTIEVRIADAKNKISLPLKDENGNELGYSEDQDNFVRQYLSFNLPGQERSGMFTMVFGYRNTFYMSDFSKRISFQNSVDQDNLETQGKLRIINHSLINGLHGDSTIANNPSDYKSQTLDFNFPQDSPHPTLILGNFYGSLGRTKDIPVTGKNKKITLLSNEPLSRNKVTASFRGYKDVREYFNDSSVFETEVISIDNGSFVNRQRWWDDFPVIYKSGDKQEMSFGKSLNFIQTPYDLSLSNVRGSLREEHHLDGHLLTYELFDENSKVIKSGKLRELNMSAYRTKSYQINIANNQYYFGKIKGKSTISCKWKNYNQIPQLYALSFLNKNGSIVNSLKDKSGEVSFSIYDNSINKDKTKLYIKDHTAKEWQSVSLTSASPIDYLNIFSCKLSKADIKTDTFDIKIISENSYGSSIEFILEPAIFIGNTPPVITGQKVLTGYRKEATKLNLEDLLASDDDDNYPNGFTLSILPGNGYTVKGQSIIPQGSFIDKITVPVYVNDGMQNSNTFNLAIKISNYKPIIEAQTEEEFYSNTSFEIKMGNLTVADADDEMSPKFYLKMEKGENYTYKSNVITPAPNFAGILSIPLSVSDGNDFSDVFNFKVKINKEINPEHKEIIFPNPNEGNFRFPLISTDSSPIKCEILNSLGKVVFEQVYTPAVAQKYIEIKMNNNPEMGVYSLKLAQNGKYLSRKFIIK